MSRPTNINLQTAAAATAPDTARTQARATVSGELFPFQIHFRTLLTKKRKYITIKVNLREWQMGVSYYNLYVVTEWKQVCGTHECINSSRYPKRQK